MTGRGLYQFFESLPVKWIYVNTLSLAVINEGAARRAGTTAAFDQLNKYFTIMEMPIVSSQYWNMVHGRNPDEVRQDLEGLQIMRTLGKNMAFFLKCKEAGIKAGIAFPEQEARVFTNFIR